MSEQSPQPSLSPEEIKQEQVRQQREKRKAVFTRIKAGFSTFLTASNSLESHPPLSSGVELSHQIDANSPPLELPPSTLQEEHITKKHFAGSDVIRPFTYYEVGVGEALSPKTWDHFLSHPSNYAILGIVSNEGLLRFSTGSPHHDALIALDKERKDWGVEMELHTTREEPVLGIRGQKGKTEMLSTYFKRSITDPSNLKLRLLTVSKDNSGNQRFVTEYEGPLREYTANLTAS